MMRARIFGSALFFSAILSIRATAQKPEQPPPALAGQTLFNQFCVVCHGPMLQGSPLGPGLNTPTVRAKSDHELVRQIAEGNLQQGMPAFGRGLAKDEVFALVGFLRSTQQRMTSAATAKSKPYPIEPGGDPVKGEALFKGKAACFECHSVSYVGGTVGPDLTRVGERLMPGEIYEAVVTPSKKILRDYQAKTFVKKDGQTITGRFRYETPATIQILNKTGDLWTTYIKKDLSQFSAAKDSLMPENILQKLAPDETKDLFAYLTELK